MANRPETGPMQAPGDWPGVFIRGDESFFFAHSIDMALKLLEDSPCTFLVRNALRRVKRTLDSCNVHDESFDAAKVTQINVIGGE